MEDRLRFSGSFTHQTDSKSSGLFPIRPGLTCQAPWWCRFPHSFGVRQQQHCLILRFLLIARAGRVTRIGGRQVLRLAQNPAIEDLYTRIQHALAA